MIRIETSERRDLVTLALSGRIQAEDLPELKRVMESYSKPVVLDLTGVKLAAPRFLGEKPVTFQKKQWLKWFKWIAAALILSAAAIFVWQRYFVKHDEGLASGKARRRAQQLEISGHPLRES
jgi:hypothetical protein